MRTLAAPSWLWRRPPARRHHPGRAQSRGGGGRGQLHQPPVATCLSAALGPGAAVRMAPPSEAGGASPQRLTPGSPQSLPHVHAKVLDWLNLFHLLAVVLKGAPDPSQASRKIAR